MTANWTFWSNYLKLPAGAPSRLPRKYEQEGRAQAVGRIQKQWGYGRRSDA
jgi:hypothetical protein